MSKNLFLYALVLVLFSCQNIEPNKSITDTQNLDVGFEADLSVNPELIYEKLQLIPIVADDAFISNNVEVADYQGLNKAIENPKFRIVEKKSYGRQNDAGAVNSLTVLNKSDEVVFLMAGDIVEGGNQDRVLAQDRIIQPHTITDVSVFCVERNRWSPRNEEDQTAQPNSKRAIAFSGYYNVASSDLRKTIIESKNQEKVWEKVEAVTAINNAKSETGTYANLENSDTYTTKRDEYLQFFDGKFLDDEHVIGVIAVSGNKMLATDIFAHPNLFKSKFPSLIHSYVTDAITNGQKVSMEVSQKEKLSKSVQSAFKYDGGSKGLIFKEQDKFIHMVKY